jgi:hypothetical protein
MATFLQLYGTDLDTELGSADRTVLFTTTLRKAFVNQGVARFNDETGCYVKRAAISLTDAVGEYDLELLVTDYQRLAKTLPVLKQDPATGDDVHLSGELFQFTTEAELDATIPDWRSASPGTPTKWYLRRAIGAHYFGLYVAPDVPAGDAWSVLFPYVAAPPTLSADGDIPFSGLDDLYPYHRGPLYYAAAQCEKLRKNWDGVTRQMQAFAAVVALYRADLQPPSGTRIRLAQNYRRLRAGVLVGRDPYR